MSAFGTAEMIDGVAQIMAEAVSGSTVFGAGTTDAVTGSFPQVVPLADDFLETGDVAVVVALGTWQSRMQPTNERLEFSLNCSIWRWRIPLGQNVNALYADRDAICDAVLAHSKGHQTEAHVQSVMLQGGPGVVERTVDGRMFLTLPFIVNVVSNRTVSPQPA